MSSPANGPPWTTVAPDPGAMYHYSHPRTTIDSLPFEILVFIFSLSHADGWAGLALTALQLVCRKWRDVIVNSVVFWRSVNITLRDNDQVRRIKLSLHSRLRHRWPTTPLHVNVTLFGLWEHDEQCECDRDGSGKTEVCEWQADLLQNFYELLKILIGPKGRYMSRWASFLVDVFQWDSSLLWEQAFEFDGIFDHPAPLLEKLQLWSLKSPTRLFPDTPLLSAVRLRECELDNPIDLAGIRRVWIDLLSIRPGSTCVNWDDLSGVQELTLRVGTENDMDSGDLLDGLVFTDLRKLRLLGVSPKKLLEAVADCKLEELVLRVNSPDDLHSVVNSGIVLQDIDEVVLGGFFRDSYAQDGDDSAESLALAEARHAAFRALFHSRNGLKVTNVTLLGMDIGNELAAAGITINTPRYWDDSRNKGELGAIAPWAEDEWDGNQASFLATYGGPRDEDDEIEDEDTDEGSDEDEDEDVEGSNL